LVGGRQRETASGPVKTLQWPPVQRWSATCSIGNLSALLVRTVIPGMTNGLFASFS